MNLVTRRYNYALSPLPSGDETEKKCVSLCTDLQVTYVAADSSSVLGA